MALTIPKVIPPEKMKMLNVNQQLMDDLGSQRDAGDLLYE